MTFAVGEWWTGRPECEHNDVLIDMMSLSIYPPHWVHIRHSVLMLFDAVGCKTVTITSRCSPIGVGSGFRSTEIIIIIIKSIPRLHMTDSNLHAALHFRRCVDGARFGTDNVEDVVVDHDTTMTTTTTSIPFINKFCGDLRISHRRCSVRVCGTAVSGLHSRADIN